MKAKQIFDIFSVKKIKTKKKKQEKILIDYREKNSLVASELVDLNLKIEFKDLKVGDYIVKNTAIERKTVNDFISSIKNKRLMNQLEELQQYKNKLLIIEGIDEQELYTDLDEEIGMHPNAVRGFLLSVLLKYRVPIIFTKNYEDTAKFILILSKKKEKEISLNITKKNLNAKERKQFIIEGFPGIGPKTAKKLLKKFKTIQNIINAPEKELKELIGKKAEIFKLVKKRY